MYVVSKRSSFSVASEDSRNHLYTIMILCHSLRALDRRRQINKLISIACGCRASLYCISVTFLPTRGRGLVVCKNGENENA